MPGFLALPYADGSIGPLTLFMMLNLAALFVGMSKGGLPVVAMLSVPILSLVMSPLKAAALLLPVYILSDVVGVYLYRRKFSTANLKILIPAGLGGVVIGWATASWVSDRGIALLVGLVGVGFCVNLWLRRGSVRPARPVHTPTGLFWGTLAGFTSFVSHAGGPPYQIYVLPQKLEKLVFAGTTTILFAVINLAKIVPYSLLEPYSLNDLKISAVLLPVAMSGTVLGAWFTRHMPDVWFFRAVQAALFLISIQLIVKSLAPLWSTH